jgi:hypothetical protein
VSQPAGSSPSYVTGAVPAPGPAFHRFTSGWRLSAPDSVSGTNYPGARATAALPTALFQGHGDAVGQRAGTADDPISGFTVYCLNENELLEAAGSRPDIRRSGSGRSTRRCSSRASR